jgi:hypothetical protein
MKYLRELQANVFHLDHRLTPEVRAMLASMASRLPAGGIRARYREIVEAVAEGLAEEAGWPPLSSLKEDPEERNTVARFLEMAEDRLCTYPLPAKVQGFFDEFVGRYGHSSIQEQVGDPAIYVEGISWFTAWLLFDSPLVRGQEFSTRAVRHKDWPMAHESFLPPEEAYELLHGKEPGRSYEDALRGACPPGINGAEWRDPVFRTWRLHVYKTTPAPALERLHKAWLELFEAEVEAWREHLSDPRNREALGIGDREPFRPALDRARWALPGTISTGACFTSDLRERSRVLAEGTHLGINPPSIWGRLVHAYAKAQPGIGTHALKKTFSRDHQTPVHLQALFTPVEDFFTADGVMVRTYGSVDKLEEVPTPPERARKNTYADPWLNREVLVEVDMECSLAVARDWHRHRTLYPWFLGLLLDSKGQLQIARDYSPKSERASQILPDLLAESTAVYRSYKEAGDPQRAALALPLGTRCYLTGAGGYRDVLYALELRAGAHGANFEYKRQAEVALKLLQEQTGADYVLRGTK